MKLSLGLQVGLAVWTLIFDHTEVAVVEDSQLKLLDPGHSKVAHVLSAPKPPLPL